jgi:hypothetical protein
VLKRGTLKVGQPVVVGCEWGKVRSLRGPGGAVLKELLPGQAAEISGLRGLPDAGDPLLVRGDLGFPVPFSAHSTSVMEHFCHFTSQHHCPRVVLSSDTNMVTFQLGASHSYSTVKDVNLQ